MYDKAFMGYSKEGLSLGQMVSYVYVEKSELVVLFMP